MKSSFTKKLAITLLFASAVFTASAVNDTIVKTGHVWKYLDNGSNQGTAWRTTSFNDASWASGPSQLGYGDGDEATVVSYGPSSNNKYITTYFRKSISVTNLANYASLTMKIKRDDGIVVYINGTERYRSNMPSGTISYNTYASGNASNDGNSWITVSLPLSALVSGNNVIAAEIHQRNANSSDITFDLMLYGDYSCGTPTGLSTTSITSNSATVNWAAGNGATNYSLQYKTAASSTWTTVSTGNVTSYTLTGLLNNTAYNWRVSRTCVIGTSSTTATQNFTTLPTPCNTPTGLTSSSISTSSATISWAAVSGASSYDVWYREVGAPTWSSQINAVSTSLNLTGLNYSTNYEWQVHANCSGGSQSAWSSSATFTTLTPVCNTPSGLSSSAVTTSTATVSWSTVTGASNYTVQYRIIGAPSWTTASNTASTSLALSGLTYSSNYEWQVRTNCIYGNQSAWSSGATFTTQTPVCNVPGGLMTTGITTSSATVSWNAVTGASSYDVQYREVGAGIWNSTNTALTNATLNGLNYSSQYEWQVRTNCIYGNQSTFSSSVIFTTNNLPCNDASNLVVSNITTTSADLSWDAVSGSVSYNINFREVGAGTWNSTSSLTNNVTLSGLNPAANYEWQVEAICQFNNSNFVNGSNFTTATPVCNDVTNLSVTNITYTTADLNWNLVSGAISYNVIYRQVGMGIFNTVSTSGNSITVSGLNPSTDYEWLVQSVCQYSSGNFASGNNFTTNIPSCGDPANLTAGNITTTTANLSWDAVSGALSYNINYRVIGAGTWNSTSSVSNSILLSGLNPVSDYEWQVQAICQYTGSGFVNGNNFTTATPPCNDAANLVVTNITTTSADLNWDAVNGALSYSINYREVGAGTWNNITSTTNSVSITGLNPVQDYEWQIQAVCQYLNSNFVNGNNFTTATPPCNDATNLSVSNITVSSADLNWDAVNGALSYNINYREVGAGAWNNTTSLTNSVSISGLNPVQDYEWQVQVICQYLNSNVVNGNNFTTTTPPCNDAINLNVSNITVSSADLNWDAVSGAISYNINYRIVGAGSWNSTTSLTNIVSITGLNPAENYEWQVQTVCQYSNSNFVSGNNFTTATPPCNDATNLSVSNITVSSADLNWDAVSGAISYNINYRIVGAGSWSSTSSLTNSASLSGLNSTSEYEWQVQVICQYAGSNFANGNNFTTATPPCNDVINLSVSNITVSSADLNWDAVSGALSYNIDYRIVGAGAWNNTSSLTNSISLTGLNPVSDYEWRVQSVCSAGNGTFVNGNNFTTATPPCNDVTNLNVSNIGTNNADLSWDVVSGATGYNIQYRITGATTWSTANSTVNSLSLTGLTYSSTYEWQVQTVCQYSNSNFTSGNNFITLTPACDVPSGQASSAITTSSATVSWAAVTGASSYDVQYREVGAGSWNAAINTASTSLSLSSLSYSTNYEWQVRTNCIYGNQSAYSASATFTTLTPACDVATGQASSAITTSSATVSWAAVTGASSYDVQYREVGAGSWNAAINTASTSLAFSSLSYSTNYEWQVRTNCIYGNQSAYSASATFTTSTPACDVATGQASSAITTSSATVSWSAVTDASSYDVQYREVGAGSWNAAINTASTSIALSGLNYNTNYEWQVRTNCIYGNQSAYSASATFLTLTPTCNVPTGQSSSAVTTATATVSWSAGTGASTYTVQYRIVGAPSWTTASNTASTSLGLTGLSYSSNYEWQVRTNCIYGNQSAFSASSNFITSTPACNVPTGQASSAITASSATVSWSAVTGASSYDVQYRVVGAGSWNVAINTASTSLSLSSLSYSTNYEWQVRTNCTYGNQSAYSSSSTFTTLAQPCDVPSGILSGTVTATSAKILWETVTNAVSYNVRYRVNGGSTWTTLNSVVNNITITGLSGSTKYECQVSTVCSGNSSAYSSSVVFTTSASQYADSLLFAYGNWKYFDSGTNPGTDWKLLSFNDASWLSGNAELGYGDSDESTVVSYGPDANNKYITTYFRKKINVTNASSYVSLSLKAVRDDGIVVYLNGTELYRTNMPTGTVTNSTLATAAISGTDESAWQTATVSTAGLVNGDNMIAVEIHQSGVTSTDISFNLNLGGNTPPPACNTPTGLSSTSITTSSANVSWNSVAGASSYDVQYRVVGAGSWNTAINTASTSLSLTGLNYSSNYEWQVRTNCIYGNQSAYSSSATFTTLTPTCNVPSGLGSSGISSTTATVSWGAVTGASTYDVQYRIVGAGSWNAAINTASTSLNLSGLTASTNYEWQVRTNCTYGNQSAYSSSATFTTTSAAVCNTPAGLSIASVTTTGATASWTAVSGALTYTVRYRTIGNATWTTAANTASTSLALTGLTTSKTYEVQVSTNCSGGSSAYSASVDFTTSAASTILTRGPYLQMVTPTSIVIRWRSSASTNSYVRYGTDMSVASSTTDAASVTDHVVTVTGLTAGTKYFYTIGSTTVDYQGDVNNYFYTSLPTGSTAPFRVWATGDFGNNSTGQANTRNAMETYTAGNRPDLWVWQGDNAYSNGTDAEYTNNVFNIYPNQFKNIPAYPCLGNHDYGQTGYLSATSLGTTAPYFTIFSCPTSAQAGGVASGTEKYYSYNYGNVHFIVLDSYGSLNAAGSPQRNWLINDLAANTQRFTIVMFHHPPYSHGTHNSDTETEMVDMRNNFTPLFDQYKVDLVLNGHSHTYERTWLIKGHQGVASTFTNAMKVDATNGNSPYYLKSSANNFDGTVYCVIGVSGQGGSVSTLGTWPHNAMVSYSKTLWGSLIIDVNNDTLETKFLTSTGTIYDQFKIVKSGTARYISSPASSELVSDLEVFPNPFSNELNVHFSLGENSPLQIEVFDLVGKRIYATGNKYGAVQVAGEYEMQLTEAELGNATGFLMIRLTLNDKVITKIIERIK